MYDQSIMIIKPKKQNMLLFYALFFLGFPILTYYVYRQPDWIRLVFYGLVWLLIFAYLVRQLIYKIKGKNIYHDLTIKLTPQGFYLGDIIHRWSDIDNFWTKKEYITLFSLFSKKRVVCWNYNPNYIKKPVRLLSAYDETLSTEYEMESDKLAELLNDWKTRYSAY